MTTWTVIIKVQAETSAGAADAACEFLNNGGEPDAVLSCGVSFPDPDMEGAKVTI